MLFRLQNMVITRLLWSLTTCWFCYTTSSSSMYHCHIWPLYSISNDFDLWAPQSKPVFTITAANKTQSGVCVHPPRTGGISEWMWLLIELLWLLCLYMVTKWSAAFMVFPWSSGRARSRYWKENLEFTLETRPPAIFPPHQVQSCSKGKEASVLNELLSLSIPSLNTGEFYRGDVWSRCWWNGEWNMYLVCLNCSSS